MVFRYARESYFSFLLSFWGFNRLVQSGKVRSNDPDQEVEEISDYFISYGQAYSDFILYDMDSEMMGNEMRFINSAQNMGRPSNVRIEGRVLDILFINLPCVIATRNIKAGDELLLDYVVEEGQD